MVDPNLDKIRSATPPMINWSAASLNTSPTSDSDSSSPYETINSAISKLQTMLKHKINQGLGTFSKHFDKVKDFLSIQEASNQVEQNLTDILSTQSYRNIETEYHDCDRLYSMNKLK